LPGFLLCDGFDLQGEPRSSWAKTRSSADLASSQRIFSVDNRLACNLKLEKRASGWLESDIDAWIEARKTADA
jgi:hypothetical protein